MKGRYYVCFWLLVLGIVRVDCHLRRKLQTLLGGNFNQGPQRRPIQDGSYEVFKGSMEDLNSFNAEWICTNRFNNNKMFIGSDQMNQFNEGTLRSPQNGNQWNGGVYTPPQEYYPPTQSQGNQGISYQPEIPQQQYPSQQVPPNSQQGHQNPPQLLPQHTQSPFPQNVPHGQDQSAFGSSGLPVTTQTSTNQQSPATDDSSLSFANFDWNAYVTIKPGENAGGAGIIQPRVIN